MNTTTTTNEYVYEKSSIVQQENTNTPSSVCVYLNNQLIVDDLQSMFKNETCKVKNLEYENESYTMIGYDKKKLKSGSDSGYYNTRLFRSCIFDNTSKMMCFSPPKSIDYEIIYKTIYDCWVVEEFVEGTMINLFWVNGSSSSSDYSSDSISDYDSDPDYDYSPINGKWEIATRNTVGGETTFFKSDTGEKNITFRSMFFEAVAHCRLNIDLLDKRFCYSFVLQHPKNKMVAPILQPMLYLVEAYTFEYSNLVNEDNYECANLFIQSVDVYDPSIFIQKAFCGNQTTVRFPLRYNSYSVDNMEYILASLTYTPYHIMGFVARNLVSGLRTKMRNPNYELVKHFSGKPTNLQYRYLELRNDAHLLQFIHCFPERFGEYFDAFGASLDAFVTKLYRYYVECYIKRSKPLREFPDNYRTHMYNIHKMYIEYVKPIGFCISKEVVWQFIHNIPTPLLMHSINYTPVVVSAAAPV